MTSETYSVNGISVTKIYGVGNDRVTALNDVSIAIKDNEFFVLLGPSGCGKTTLLRCIAGFETLSKGNILLFNEGIDHLPPNRRPVNTVFQNYALFPHMTVATNIAFSLKMLNRTNLEIEKTVTRMLELVHMTEFADRYPAQLSGGQQQRVALARALASQPKVLLLDEPLSALDLKLRQAMRIELKQLQEETGITFLLVTHDQDEALTMGDRIAVMSNGEIQQIGTPQEIYENPANLFVAGFIGETNSIQATVISVNQNIAQCALAEGTRINATLTNNISIGEIATLFIRPEKIALQPAGNNESINGVIDRLIYLGTDTHYLIHLNDQTPMLVRVQNNPDTRRFKSNDRVSLSIDESTCHLLTN